MLENKWYKGNIRRACAATRIGPLCHLRRNDDRHAIHISPSLETHPEVVVPLIAPSRDTYLIVFSVAGDFRRKIC